VILNWNIILFCATVSSFAPFETIISEFTNNIWNNLGESYLLRSGPSGSQF
jgi:hypothetical protein